MPKFINKKQYYIIRTYSAGVYAGYIQNMRGKSAVILNSRGLWYWDGACGLSQLATDGTSEPDNCKFTIPVQKRLLTEIIEVIPCTRKAELSIKGVKLWKR